MFINEELLAIIFRLVNFGLLIFLCVHIFKRYLLPTLQEEITAQENKKREVQERHSVLAQQEKMAGQCFDDQKVACEQLQEKVHIWADARAAYEQRREQQKKDRQQQLKERIFQQEQWVQYTAEQKEIIPRALEIAHKKLLHLYQSDDAQRKYIAHVLKCMQQEES